jgi:hypothetical protein
MELTGALWNPFTREKPLLSGLIVRQRELLEQAETSPRTPRSATARPHPALRTVTDVLLASSRPMRAREIHGAAEQLLGEPLRWASVRGILSAYTIGGDRRFRRLRRGLSELALTRPPQAPGSDSPRDASLPVHRPERPVYGGS